MPQSRLSKKAVQVTKVCDPQRWIDSHERIKYACLERIDQPTGLLPGEDIFDHFAADKRFADNECVSYGLVQLITRFPFTERTPRDG